MDICKICTRSVNIINQINRCMCISVYIYIYTFMLYICKAQERTDQQTDSDRQTCKLAFLHNFMSVQ